MKIEVIIVDDILEIREHLQQTINLSESFYCSFTFGSAEALIHHLKQSRPSIIMMDIDLPGINGIAAISKLKPLYPNLLFMVLTVFEESDKVFSSLRAGASGYLTKKTPFNKIEQALLELHNGGSPMNAEIARMVVNSFNESITLNHASLTAKENEILNLLANGYRYKEIAHIKNLSIDTIRTHVRNIYNKLQVNSRMDAINKIRNINI